MLRPLDDDLLPADPEKLQAEIAEAEARQTACAKHITFLINEEIATGVSHAAAIHEHKQLKMMLQYQKELRTVRLLGLHHSES